MSHPILGDVMLQSEFVLTEITYVILLAVAAVVAIATRHGAKLGLPKVEKGFAVETVWPKLGGLPPS